MTQNYLMRTKRVGVRLLKKEDISYLFELESDPVVQKFSPYGVKTYEQTEAVVNEFMHGIEHRFYRIKNQST